jgi:transcriptional regulator with XRE-family HTH domain
MMDSIGTRLQAARRARGLTQEALARQAGVSLHTVVKLESGRIRQPLPETARKLAAALGVDPAWLLFGEGTLHEPSSERAQKD